MKEKFMDDLHPIRLEASLHETIWGGRRLEQSGWKTLPVGEVLIGEAWETESNAVAQNEPYRGKTLGMLVEESGPSLLGEQTMTIFGRRFPLLAKFIDANAKLSVQVHPDDSYAAKYAGGSLGKTECWYVLDAVPGASIVHGFRTATSRNEVQQAIGEVRLEDLLHEEQVQAGDVIFVPAGTVHAIGGGILLYELQEYSEITYRMYDYGRLTTAGIPRELHIERALDVASYIPSARVKVNPVMLARRPGYEDRCLVACQYFLVRELRLAAGGVINHARTDYAYADQVNKGAGSEAFLEGETGSSCVILSSLGAEVQVSYGAALKSQEPLSIGQTMVLPAALGRYRIEGTGNLLLSYVPTPDDEAWQLWNEENN
jgi:mannose-6-phosphate isomerase